MGEIIVTLFWFLVVLTPLVFVHEFGHYWVAKRNGVRVEVFFSRLWVLKYLDGLISPILDGNLV